MQDAAGALQATPSSLSSYPTYTPPPPPPPRSNGCVTSATEKKVEQTHVQRIVYEECKEVLQAIRSDGTVSVNSGGGSIASVMANARHEKYRAILAEVEQLNRVLEVTIDERDEMKGELHEKLKQAEMSLRERDKMLEEKDAELLRLKHVVSSLTVRLEALEGERCKEVDTRFVDGGKSGRCSNFDVQKALGIHADDVFPAHKMNATISRNSSTAVDMAASDSVTSTVTRCTTNGTISASFFAIRHVAQSALRWVKFLLERCFSREAQNTENVAALLTAINYLLSHSRGSSMADAVVQPLCTQVSNCLTGLMCKETDELQTIPSPTLIPGGREHTLHDEESKLQQLVACLKAEREALKQHVCAVSEENVQLLRKIKTLEESSTLPPLHVQKEHLEVQNAMHLAGRNKQNAFIDKLEQQVRRLEEEKRILEIKIDQQTESLQRHECVLDFLSHHGCGVGGTIANDK